MVNKRIDDSGVGLSRDIYSLCCDKRIQERYIPDSWDIPEDGDFWGELEWSCSSTHCSGYGIWHRERIYIPGMGVTMIGRDSGGDE